MSVALELLASLVDSTMGLEQYVRLGLTPELFRGPDEELCWKLLSQFTQQYGALPSRERFIEIGVPLPQAKEPSAYYLDRLKDRHRHLTLKQALISAQEALNGDQSTQAHGILTDAVLSLTRTAYHRRLVDFAKEGKQIVSEELKKKKSQGDLYGIKFGWPTLDDMAEGLSGGDLVTMVGKSGAGKSYCFLYAASYSWANQSKSPLLISMEMKPLIIIQRLAAINAKKPITQIKKAELSSHSEKELLQKLASYEDKQPFWVVDGALAATIEDIVLLTQMVKPDSLWIDGAYLIRSRSPQRSMWERVTEIIEQVKSNLAERLNIPVAISFQFNRKQSKNEKGSLDRIALSDSVGQLSSLVLGLGLAEDEDSPEALHKRRIEVLKGRHGEVGDFQIHWRFDSPGPDYMNFSEIKDPDLGDLQYGTN